MNKREIKRPTNNNKLVSDIAIQLQEIQRQLHEAGLSASAQKVNEAMNVMGYEAAGKQSRKDKP